MKKLNVFLITILLLSPLLSQSAFFFANNLSEGDELIDVFHLQQRLNENPVTRVAETGVGSIGNETNYFGNLTKSAVIRFQELFRDQILTPNQLTSGTGFVGPSTRNVLNSTSNTAPIVSTPIPVADTSTSPDPVPLPVNEPVNLFSASQNQFATTTVPAACLVNETERVIYVEKEKGAPDLPTCAAMDIWNTDSCFGSGSGLFNRFSNSGCINNIRYSHADKVLEHETAETIIETPNSRVYTVQLNSDFGGGRFVRNYFSGNRLTFFCKDGARQEVSENILGKTYKIHAPRLVPTIERERACRAALQQCWEPYFKGENNNPACPAPTTDTLTGLYNPGMVPAGSANGAIENLIEQAEETFMNRINAGISETVDGLTGFARSVMNGLVARLPNISSPQELMNSLGVTNPQGVFDSLLGQTTISPPWSQTFGTPFGGRVNSVDLCTCSGAWRVHVSGPGLPGTFAYMTGMSQFSNNRLAFPPGYWTIGLYAKGVQVCYDWVPGTPPTCVLTPTQGMITPIAGTSAF